MNALSYQTQFIENDFASISSIILSVIEESRPFSLIRLGHCEPRIMGFPDFITRKTVNKTLVHQFNKSDYSEADIVEMGNLLCHSVSNADIIGIGYPQELDSEFTALWRLTHTILERKKLVNFQKFCDVNIHYRLATSGLFYKMFRFVKNVRIITCRDVKDLLKTKFQLHDIEHIVIPEHAATIKDKSKLTRHWPQAFIEVQNRIRNSSPSLYLVGAGFLGKSYCSTIKEAGGIAIDMGSVFDFWAGLETRSGQHEVFINCQL